MKQHIGRRSIKKKENNILKFILKKTQYSIQTKYTTIECIISKQINYKDLVTKLKIIL